MPPLDGCEGGEMVVILQQKPDLDGSKGSARISSAERVHIFSAVLAKANPSIYLIDIGCMLHESGYNVHSKPERSS